MVVLAAVAMIGEKFRAVRQNRRLPNGSPRWARNQRVVGEQSVLEQVVPAAKRTDFFALGDHGSRPRRCKESRDPSTRSTHPLYQCPLRNHGDGNLAARLEPMQVLVVAKVTTNHVTDDASSKPGREPFTQIARVVADDR